MNKKEIIDTINKYKLDKEQFIVISGSALVLNDVKENTNDIDIWCSDSYFNYLLEKYNCKYKKTNKVGEKIYFMDEYFNIGVSFKPEQINLVEGIKVASLNDVLEFKQFLNREKDKEDIDLIRNIIESNYKKGKIF